MSEIAIGGREFFKNGCNLYLAAVSPGFAMDVLVRVAPLEWTLGVMVI